MIRPDKGRYPVTQGFGDNPNLVINGVRVYGPEGHDGVDLGTPVGSPLYAPRSGRVKDVNNHPAYGLRIKIDNGKNVDYVGHLSQAQVSIGQQVSEGQQIGLSGRSGNVTGPHTHWGLFDYSGRVLNPQAELNNQGGNMPSLTNDGDVVNLYRRELGRDPDPGGRAVFTNMDWPRAWYGITESDEYRNRQNLITSLIQSVDPLKAAVESLSSRPTKEEYAAVQAQINDKLTEISELQKKLTEEQAKKTEDTQLLDDTRNIFQRIWDRIFHK